MKRHGQLAAIDGFRLPAALLVVAIHTSPLTTYSILADFWLTRVLARIAVPFFFMASGYFLAQKGWRATGKFLKELALLYGVSILICLPLNLYMGGFRLEDLPRLLLFDGTLYHLWYFPAAMLGVLVAKGLSRLGLRLALPLAVLLYLVGLGGDSYYGLAVAVPGLRTVYSILFRFFSYTRNGLFFAPLFLLLGAAGKAWKTSVSLTGFLMSLAAMSAEAFWLRRMEVQRHDSMYLLLPVCMVFLFALLLWNNGRRMPAVRDISLLIYILHPWCIVLVRMGARVLGMEQLLIGNSLGHFLAVVMLSGGLSMLLYALRPRKTPPDMRAWREIDRAALAHNAEVLQAALGTGCQLIAVVKADAYGHGAVQTARVLRKQGVRAFAVACLDEAIRLRRAGICGTILVLGYTPPEQVPLLVRWHITQAVVDAEHAEALSAQSRRVRVHLALDTGMHRLGLDAGDIPALLQVFRLPKLRIEGMFTHLCVADSRDPADVDYTVQQTERFHEAVKAVQAAGYDPGLTHLQASYGIWNLPVQSCGYARAGIALYGVRSDNTPVQNPLDLWPVMSLRARVISVRWLQPGDTAGYGRAFVARRDTCLAVVSVGYADGLPRDWAERGGEVLIRSRHVPVVGRVCMDQLLADVTGMEEVRSGDVATLIGRDGGAVLRAEDVAEQCGTITNELLSGLSTRLGLCIR